MRKTLLLIIFLSCFCANAEELEVIHRAKSWLTLIDNGQYQQSWQQADSLFKLWAENASICQVEATMPLFIWLQKAPFGPVFALWKLEYDYLNTELLH